MRACIKFGGNLMHVSGFLSGGFLMGVEAFYFEWELHPHECGRGGGSPMAGSHAPWVPPLSPIKGPPLLLSKRTSSRRISLPPLEFPMVSDQRDTCSRWLFLEGFVASAASLERGRGGCRGTRTCVRSRMHHCFEMLDLIMLDRLDQMDFITILRSASVRLHHP